ncbi:hypothetical protein [Streptomyces sp. NPDC058193]|uniref:hypothetical protein n=1 Tax=Streptomyces sp. NPDC058193 TaxID=3346373 RepID=UPI0036E9DFDC
MLFEDNSLRSTAWLLYLSGVLPLCADGQCDATRAGSGCLRSGGEQRSNHLPRTENLPTNSVETVNMSNSDDSHLDHIVDFPISASPIIADPLLRTLLITTNVGMSFSVCVVAGGKLIQGDAINRDDWWNLLLSHIRTAGSHGEMFASSIKKAADDVGYHLFDDEIQGQDRPMRLHLKDAYIEGTNAGLVRVRVDQIAAWSLGTSRPKEKRNHEIE